MSIVSRPAAVLLPALVVVLGARPVDAGETLRLRDGAVVEHGFARAVLAGHRLRSATVTVEPNGDGSGALSYAGSDGRVRFTMNLAWREPPQAGVDPAADWSPGPLGKGPDRIWHPQKQVRISFSDANPSEAPDLDGLLSLAREEADLLAARARFWPAPLAELDLERELLDHLLTGTHQYEDRAGFFVAELSYRRRTWTTLEDARGLPVGATVKLTFRWFPRGRRPSSADAGGWRFVPEPEATPSLSRPVFPVDSPTHLVRVQLRGGVIAPGADPDRFQDRTRFDEGMALALELRQRIERRLAEPRDPSEVGTPTPSSPDVEERPDAPGAAPETSGTLSRVTGRVTVIRGGQRVNLRDGGRVQRGDTIITGDGQVVVTFDDPAAGPTSNGMLVIGPRSRVTIDVGPRRREEEPPPTRIRLEAGAVRFKRPHHHENPRVELGIPGEVAIFGLTGTDATLYERADGFALALRDGMADLTVGGQHVKVIVPISVHLVGHDGTVLASRTIDAEMYAAGAETVGVALD